MKKYIVYSKPDCPQCEAVKKLLESKGLEFDYLMLDVNFTKNELVEAVQGISKIPPRSVPQIFVEENGLMDYIGGSKEFIEYLK